MTTLDPNDHYMVLINTFTVSPERADELLEELQRGTENAMGRRPGFVSANLHVSDDRKHVTNYAQWRSRADYNAVFKDEPTVEHMNRAADIAESFDPIIYELRFVQDEPVE